MSTISWFPTSRVVDNLFTTRFTPLVLPSSLTFLCGGPYLQSWHVLAMGLQRLSEKDMARRVPVSRQQSTFALRTHAVGNV